MDGRLKVLCLVPYPTLGPSNRLRVEQYVPLLRETGIELVVSPFFDEGVYRFLYRHGHVAAKVGAVVRGGLRRTEDVLRAGKFDLVLVHRESAPLGPPLVERILRRARIPYILDFDDAIFLPAVHEANRRWAWLRDPSRVGESATGAATVIAGNEYLAEWARRHNGRVTVIATPVDTDLHVPISPAPPNSPTVVGWVGSSTTARYLHLIDEPLRVLAQRRDVTVRVVGGEYRNSAVTVDARSYVLEREPRDIASFHIGVLPEPDDAWTRGKCAFKALLYMATGLPVVASRVGVNPEVVVGGETGYCVNNDEEWVDALERLAADADLRRSLGARGREIAIRDYSLTALAPRLAAALRSAAEA